eukprot:CAMPEP_0202383506 /NCGR_PEP_ID=MMETSP1127-20130417/49615_1 /ASSEMBLY_ACC=CAM_ASM_000462 /TAXON_ID=3047 /ORGANISM="Dunaliella tertiolecta, Strain CCMP1320" /LENGTH=46 /DNA_ID= /DNA_START= /DNA_END= /DNA_ORIENTATION=
MRTSVQQQQPQPQLSSISGSTRAGHSSIDPGIQPLHLAAADAAAAA